MADKILGPQGSKRRKRFLWVPALLVACLALFVIGSAQAVHEFQFQLDGDTTSTAYSPPTGANPPYDWNSVFSVSNDSSTNTQSVSNVAALVGAGKVFASASFVRDFQSGATCTLNSTSTTFCTSDDTTYATGSKDTLGIGNGGWQCNHDANVNSKIDIMNGYVLGYVNPANGHKIFYFGMEKNKDNGTNDVGVWFLQNGASCSAPTGHVNFQGKHQDGDTLVVSEYTNGGGVSTIKAFRWAAAATGALSGDGGCIDSHDNPDPNAYSPNVTPKERGCNNKPIATGGDCKKAGALDSLCGTTNANCTTAGSACALPWNQTVTTNWLTSDATLGVGNKVVSPDFYEGGIDITAAFQGQGGTTPSCFTSIVPDTRSAASATATLFDYVLNQIGGCDSGLTTQENAAASREIPASGSITSGTDSANLKVTGSDNWKGTLTFYLCGPNVSSCDANGYQVSQATVQNTDNSNCGADCTYTSGTVNVTSAAGSGATAGQYCWHAHFEPDAASAAAGVKSADDKGTNECFTITPKTPTLSTQAGAAVALGGTISDSATLTGTANNPKNDGTNATYPSIGGTTQPADSSISWLVYGPGTGGAAQCTTAIGAPSGSPITVSGDNTYGPVTYATTHAGDTAGKYEFAASYGGEAPNTNAASGVACDTTGANHEQVIVSTSSTVTTPNITTSSIGTGSVTVSDSATVGVTGASTWSGKLSFFLCGPADLVSQSTCATGGTQISSNIAVSNSSPTVGSGNATVTRVGNYCWRGVFASDTTGVPGSSDSRSSECFTITPVTPTLSTQVVNASVVFPNAIQDKITLTGTANRPGSPVINPTVAGAAAGGTITVDVYGPGTSAATACAAGVVKSGLTVTVSGDSPAGGYGPVSYTPTAIGVYVFVASYSGDSPNTNAVPAIACASQPSSEQVTVTGNAAFTTAQDWLPNDSITLTGDAALNGTVTFTLFNDGACGANAGSSVYSSGNIAVVNGDKTGTTKSTSNTTVKVTASGTYSWLVTYHDNVLTSPPDSCHEVTGLSINNNTPTP